MFMMNFRVRTSTRATHCLNYVPRCLTTSSCLAMQSVVPDISTLGNSEAALKTERLLGEQQPSSRVLLGADSQVALGTLIKGRATSRALNQELTRSIPCMLGFDVYLECLYFHTKLNRGDDPTRGREIRPPSRTWPSWMEQLLDGDYDSFDRWLAFHGLDDNSVAGLPPFSELLGKQQDRADGSSCIETTEAEIEETKPSPPGPFT